MDTVYNPLETPLLAAARAAGLRTVQGLGMFVRQAELQFEAWTGSRPPADLFEALARKTLFGHNDA
jgi:shikimate dehydrogenase